MLLATSCDSRPAHEAADHGHDHEQGHDHEALDLEPVTVTVFGARVLLFMEYPQLVRGTSAQFLAHLTVLDTGEPVRSGCVTLTVGPTKLSVEAPARDGLFIPQGSFAEVGGMPATLTIESEQVRETLTLGVVFVHADDHAAQHAAGAAAAEPPSDAIPFLLEQQWKVKLRFAQVEARTLVERLDVPAQLVTPSDAEAVVSPAVSGRLLAGDSGSLPRVGERVQAGQVLGFVEPPLDASAVAQLRALELQLLSLDLELDLKTLEVARATHEAQARLVFAEQESARIASLRVEGLSTVQQQEEAEQNLAVARADELAARSTRVALDDVVARRSGESRGRAPQSVRLPLVAPIDGVVVARTRVVGETVHAGDELWRVIDPASLWIEGRIFEFDLARVPPEPSAILAVPALDGRRLDVAAAGGRRLPSAPIVDDSTRTLAIRFEIPNPNGELKSGMLATLSLATQRALDAVAIPEDAVVLDLGTPTAYVLLAGEIFQKRELELGIRDSGLVEVKRGLRAGEHVATHGAQAVKLSAMSPASFGHGHAH